MYVLMSLFVSLSDFSLLFLSSSQELLAAIDSERRFKSRNISPVSFAEDFDTGLVII